MNTVKPTKCIKLLLISANHAPIILIGYSGDSNDQRYHLANVTEVILDGKTSKKTFKISLLTTEEFNASQEVKAVRPLEAA
ncbi:MAG: hypothetical protein QM500_13910 [Methylococcales bacterium]